MRRAGRDIKQNQTGELLWRDAGGIPGEYWRASPARYWPDTCQDPRARGTQQDTWRHPLLWDAQQVHWQATLAGYSAGATSYSGSEGDTWRDPLAGCSGGILGGIHWLAGNSAGSTGKLLWDTQRDAALVKYSAGSAGELLWQDTGWGRGVEASQTRIPTYNLTTPSCRVGNKNTSSNSPSKGARLTFPTRIRSSTVTLMAPAGPSLCVCFKRPQQSFLSPGLSLLKTSPHLNVGLPTNPPYLNPQAHA